MAHSGAPTAAAAGPGGPRAAPMQHPPNERAEKRDLAGWWKNFKSRDREKKAAEAQVPQGIFGVPLQQSIRYANVAISLLNEEGESYIYGYVPIVVAKCGVFLKEKATDVEGIFRLAGSEKRIKELRVAFDSPDRFGKGLDWTGYTVHDAANILRRYFNNLPEPIIPLEFYQPFRDPLRHHQEQAVGPSGGQNPSVGDFDQDVTIQKYQGLITQLPPLNRQLLLYILDLLAVFASKSDLNKMTTANLAAIFQPGILSHPNHDMAPAEYRLSQDVLIFLIDNQDSFLIGMQGTGADPDTIREVQSGAPSPSKPPGTPTTPNRSKTVIGRAGSNASAGAESIRRFGSLRRNASVSSSKHSRRSDGGPVPVGTPPTPTGSGVHRSNTVPSRRGGSNTSTQGSPRFSKEQQKSSDPSTPNVGAPIAATTSEESSKARPDSLQSTPVATVAPPFPVTNPAPPDVSSQVSSDRTATAAHVSSETSSAVVKDYHTPKKDTTPLLSPPGSTSDHVDRSSAYIPSGSASRGFLDIFKQSPTSDSEGQRKPNKLQKKRIPGSSLSSAQSSAHSLSHENLNDPSQRSPVGAGVSETGPSPTPVNRGSEPHANTAVAAGTHVPPQRNSTGATLRPTTSPSHSYNSITDTSDADLAGDDLPSEQVQPPAEKKRHRWRFSRTQNKLEPSSPPSGSALGSAHENTTSRSTVDSTGGGPGRRSFQEPTPLNSVTTDSALPGPTASATMQSNSTDRSNTDPVFSDSERERKGGGPMQWIRGKIQERKDKDSEKRSHTPDRHRARSSVQVSNDALPVRGMSFEQQRQQQQQQQQQQPRDSPAAPAPAPAAPVAATERQPSEAVVVPPPTTSAYNPAQIVGLEGPAAHASTATAATATNGVDRGEARGGGGGGGA